MQKDEYFSLKNYVNPSSFKGDDIKTPLHWQWNFYNPEDLDSKALKIGSAFHVLILEPHKFNDLYFTCQPDSFKGAINKDGSPSMASKENKDTLAVIRAENPNKILLYPAEAEQLYGMRDGIKRDIGKEFEYILDRKNSVFEQAYLSQAVFDTNFKFLRIEEDLPIEKDKVWFTHNCEFRLRLKTKADHVHLKKTYASDLKSTACAEPDSFANDCYSYGYFIQAAFTLDMISFRYKKEYLYFFFEVCEKTPPYPAILFECSQNLINKGREVYRRRLEYIIESLVTNQFSGYSIFSDNVTFDNETGKLMYNRKITSLDLPAWAYAKEERKQNKPLKPF